jgi:hypothetical protein
LKGGGNMPFIDKIVEFPERFDPIWTSPVKSTWWIRPGAEIVDQHNTSTPKQEEVQPAKTEPEFSLGTEEYAHIIHEAIQTGSVVDDSLRMAMGRAYFLPEPVYVEGRRRWVPYRPAECF